MGQKDSEAARWERVEDFQHVLTAGLRVSLLPIHYKDGTIPLDPPLRDDLYKVGLADAHESFFRNWARLRGLVNVPLAMFKYARTLHHLYVDASLRTHGSIDPPDSNSGLVELNQNFDVVKSGWLGGNLSVPTPFLAAVSLTDVAGIAAFDHPPEYQEAVNSLLGAVVIQAWTVFESFAEDLWVAAVNAHPTTLSELKGKPRSKFKGKPRGPDDEKPKKTAATVSVDDLQSNGFDVRRKMGSILREKDKVGFRSLGDIREAYHLAFREQAKSIDDILDEDALQYLAAVRNVLVHKGGYVDDEFFKQTRDVPGVPKLGEGDQFPLTGATVAFLADVSADCGIRLMRAVYGWIVGHPEKRNKERGTD